jgi:hypothetical protein
MLNEIPTPEAFRKEKLRVTPLELAMDDDSNGHIDFIVGTFYLQCTVSVLYPQHFYTDLYPTFHIDAGQNPDLAF